VTDSWIPFETLDERALINKAIGEKRRFVKGLRLNLSQEVPIASVALTDTGSMVSALYLGRSRVDPAYDEALTALMQTKGVMHRVWHQGDALPERSRIDVEKPVAHNNLTLS
jgi:Protein of unknown function (DUF1173)